MRFKIKIIGLFQVTGFSHLLSTALGVTALLAPPFAARVQADVIQSVSHRNDAVPDPVVGNGDSVEPEISADGRFVLFSSSANDLVPGDNSRMGLDVFLRDRAGDTTVLVSANSNGTGGGNRDSLAGQVSTNGRFVVFQSDSSDLLPGDTNDVSDIFVRDIQAGTNILVSGAMDGGWGNGAATDPVMTPDGRYVAFVSAATNLVADDTNGIPDVFVRDLVEGVTRLASPGATGAGTTMSAPAITPDGRYVVYASAAQGLAAGVSPASTGEVYVRDLVSQLTIWASTNAASVASNLLQSSNATSYHPCISDDGRFVTFKTGWTNGATASSGTAAVVILQRDLVAGRTTVISSNGFPAWVQNDDGYGPETSPDGRFVTYVATNQAAKCLAVYLWDGQAGTSLGVNVALDGSWPTNSSSDTPSVSADGRYVVFVSNATNLVSQAVADGFHVYRRDVQTGITRLVDVDADGHGSANPVNPVPCLSADGRLVAFASLNAGLVRDDPNGAFDVFVRDADANTTELISQRSSQAVAQTGDNLSSLSQYAVSDDGRGIVFASTADDLVPNDSNGASDVFFHDVATGTNALISMGVDGQTAAGASFNPVLTYDGRRAYFISTATNLVPGRTNFCANVFVRDLVAGTNGLVSVAPGGVVPGNGDTLFMAVSQDGHDLIFVSRADNLAAGALNNYYNTYLRDLVAGTNMLLAKSSSWLPFPSISADGRRVVAWNAPSFFAVRDTQTGATIYSAGNSSSAAISPTGTRVLYNSGPMLNVYNLLGKTNEFTISSKVPIKNPAWWSEDGRRFAFVTAAGAVTNDVNGTNDVYLCDLADHSLTLVSINAGHTSAAAGAADSPAISGDGRFVIYRSFATDVVAGYSDPGPKMVLFDRFTGSNRLLTAASPVSAWTSWNANPTINGDGSVVAFESWNPGLVAGDLNRARDVLAATIPPWGTTDSDGDGIPDLWMQHYFGHATGEAGDLSSAKDDADGDGISNLGEFFAGTDPHDPSSALRLQIQVRLASPADVQLAWPAVVGKNYRVQFKSNLNDSVWQEASGVVVGNQGTVEVPLEQGARFYRVRAN